LLSDSIQKDEGNGSRIKLFVKALNGVVIDVIALNIGGSPAYC
jgi:hypothetical protein